MKLPTVAILSLQRVPAAAYHLPLSFNRVITRRGFHYNSFRSHPSRTLLLAMDASSLSNAKSGGSIEGNSDGANMTSSAKVDPKQFVKPTNQHKPSPLAGIPIGPMLTSQYEAAPKSNQDGSKQDQPIIIRYMYEGGHPSQGRLCHILPDVMNSNVITVPQLISTLIQDGVDMNTFYACAYETLSSSGGWMPLEKGRRWNNPFDVEGCWKEDNNDSGIVFPIDSMGVGADGTMNSCARRIDVKLFRRPTKQTDPSNVDVLDENPFTEMISQQSQTLEHSLDALQAIQSAVPAGKIPIQGYFGIGIIQPKTSSNIGTLLRSAYQLGASLVYTIGGRYKASSTDTLNVPARIPLIEVNDWNAFVENSPTSAVWVVIEMGGTPLSEFHHPRNAIYILGSEDHGVPKNVLRACREVVSLEAAEYASYNVAVAGSIVMYDRMIKMRKSGDNTNRSKSDGEIEGS